MTKGVCLSVCLSVAAACSVEVGADPPGARRAAIRGFDDEDTARPYRYPAVVQVIPGCTGTLISPNHVLTAAHCVGERVPGSVSFAGRATDSSPATTIGVVGCFMQPDFLFLNRTRIHLTLREGLSPASAAARLGDRCGVLGRGGTLDHAKSAVDFAVLQLERPVPHAIADPLSAAAGELFVSPRPLVSAPPAAGALFAAVAVGFGNTSVGLGGGIDGVRRYVRIEASMDRFVIGGSALAPGDSGGRSSSTRAAVSR